MREAFQDIDGVCNDIVRIENRIVVCVHDLFTGTFLDVCRITGRRELFECRRISLVVGRSVTAHGMQDDESVFGDIAQIFIEVFQQDFIETAFSVTVTDVIFLDHLFVGNPVANALASVIIVFPQNLKTRLLHQIDQIFRIGCIVDIEFFTPHVREHTRDGNGCRRPAGIDILERNHIFLCKHRVGLTRISIQ